MGLVCRGRGRGAGARAGGHGGGAVPPRLERLAKVSESVTNTDYCIDPYAPGSMMPPTTPLQPLQPPLQQAGEDRDNILRLPRMPSRRRDLDTSGSLRAAKRPGCPSRTRAPADRSNHSPSLSVGSKSAHGQTASRLPSASAAWAASPYPVPGPIRVGLLKAPGVASESLTEQSLNCTRAWTSSRYRIVARLFSGITDRYITDRYSSMRCTVSTENFANWLIFSASTDNEILSSGNHQQLR